jgi:hypothetical protein
MHRSFFGLGLVLLAAACGKDSSGPASGFECLGATLPTTAPASITVSGRILQNAFAQTALPNAEVVASRTGIDTLAADTSFTDGSYSVTFATGGTPVDGFLRVLKSGLLPTYAYPSRPLAGNLTNNNVLVITSIEFGILATAVDESHTAGNGFIGVVVKDCSGTPLAGATVQTNPPGANAVHYNVAGAPSSTATSTAADGLAYVFNVPAGNVTVMATASGHTLRQHVVNARADVITLTEIQP